MTTKTRLKIMKEWRECLVDIVDQGYSDEAWKLEQLEDVIELFEDNDLARYNRELFCPNWYDRLKHKCLYDGHGERRFKRVKEFFMVPIYKMNYWRWKLKLKISKTK